MRKTVWVFVALVATLAFTTAAGGSTSARITGAQIKDHSITSIDLVDHTIRAHDLNAALVKSLKGQTGATGLKGDTGATGAAGATGAKGDKGDQGPQGPPGLKNLTADGPYPSLTQLKDYNAGENSAAAWAGDGTLQQSWVQCAADKVAFGGGFGLDDVQSDALTVVTSAPAYIKGGVVYPADTPTVGPQMSIVPNGWLVQGYNKSGHDLVVRPWVICATIVK